jgi:hypothetical protein
MKAHLLHPERDFDAEREPPPGEEALRDDLALDVLLGAMADGDEFLFEVARKALLQSLTDPQGIVYRQDALRDCLAQPAVVRELYEIAIEAIGSERRIYMGFFSRSPSMILHRSVQVLELLLDSLRRLRGLAEEHGADFRSKAFTRFFAMVRAELDDAYLASVEEHLRRLRFDRATPVAARLAAGNKGADYMLLPPPERKRGLLSRAVLALTERPDGYVYRLPDRDESGARALGELRDRGIHLVANAAGQSAEHVTDFFGMLQVELGFYVGCLNLHEKLSSLGEPTAIPTPLPAGEPELSAEGLYDPCLALRMGGGVVGNEIAADGKLLAILTGGKPGRQVDAPAQRWPGAGDDAGRDVHRGRAIPRRCPRRGLHPFQARGGRLDAERQARRGTGADERDRRGPDSERRAALQRVLRRHQRARGLRDRTPDRPRADRGRREGSLRHPPL